MKPVFSKTHFLLIVLLISFAMLFAVSQMTTETNKIYAHYMLAFNAVIVALVVYLMVKELNKTASLQSREKYLAVTLNSLAEGVITTDVMGVIQDLNPSAQKLTGWGQFEAIGRPLEIVYDVVNEQTGKPFQNVVIRVLREGKTVEFENNTLLRKKNGGEIIISNNASPIRNSEGTITGVVLVFRDITEKKQAEKAILELNETLEARVKERTEDLEFFASSVSHDLRAPLRAINGFAKILKEECKGKLDENGKNLLCTIALNAQKMDKLVEDLLKLSRLGKSELTKSSTDMSALVTSVIEDLDFSKQNPDLKIVMNDLPIANCDTGLMKQVWVNLLSNAAKYSAKNPEPKIEVGYTQKEGTDVYYVKDNGVGFDMQNADKLFGAFQRLHPTEEFEGTGVGLVIVSRVINKHGGRVFAEAESGKGASFYFALPEMN